MNSEILRICYDEGSDVLYLTTRQGVPARSDESEEPGVIWRYDLRSNELIGATIIDFHYYWRPRLNELARALAAKFDLSPDEAHAKLASVH